MFSAGPGIVASVPFTMREMVSVAGSRSVGLADCFKSLPDLAAAAVLQGSAQRSRPRGAMVHAATASPDAAKRPTDSLI